jgi:(S)-citramalyl-CoA lyase
MTSHSRVADGPPKDAGAAAEHPALSCRSMLVTSALSVERFFKDQFVGADINLIDLEDAVPADLKRHARARFLRLRPSQVSGRLGLRINSVRTHSGIRDLQAVLDAEVEPDVIVLPKVESPHEVGLADDVLTSAGRSSRLWALVESGAGVMNAPEIAAATGRLVALTFGAADFCAEIGVAMDSDLLVHARSQVVLAARTLGIEAVDSPTFELDRLNVLAEEVRKSVALGFTGKVAIHPKQVPVINDIFSPTPSDIDWATRVVAEFSNRGSCIFRIDGQMVGPPFLKKARDILARGRQNQ